MNSDYKWREQTPSRLNGPKIKDSCENGRNVSSIKSLVRRHQRNLSLPVNNVFEPLTVIIIITIYSNICNLFIYTYYQNFRQKLILHHRLQCLIPKVS